MNRPNDSKNQHKVRSLMIVYGLGIMLVFAFGCTLIDTGTSWKGNSDILLLDLATDHAQVAVGEKVHLRFTITNTGRRVQVVETTDRPIMDLTVDDALTKQTLLSWSSQHPDQVAHRLEWQPGESKTIELDWTATEKQIPYNVGVGGYLNEDSQARMTVGSLLKIYYR